MVKRKNMVINKKLGAGMTLSHVEFLEIDYVSPGPISCYGSEGFWGITLP